MPLQNFVNQSAPAIGATWLNAIDAFYFTLFNSATTAAAARTAISAAASGANTDITSLAALGAGAVGVPVLASSTGTADTGVWFPAADTVAISNAGVETIRWDAFNSPAGTAVPIVNDLRLSLTTAVPVTTADVTGATTVYLVPYKGTKISLYDGTRWTTRTTAQISLALGTLTSGRPYDIYCYDNAGTPTLEFTAWTNDTTRATALTYQDGVLVKTGALTRRYLGTFYTTSTTQTEDSATKRFLWNYYHRVARPMRVTDTTDSWTYTLAAFRQARASSANQLDMVIGVAEDTVTAEVLGLAINSVGSVAATVAIGLDSTTALNGAVALMSFAIPSTAVTACHSRFNQAVAAGRHYLAWLEYSAATGVTTWYGDGGTGTVQAGMFGTVWA